MIEWTRKKQEKKKEKEKEKPCAASAMAVPCALWSACAAGLTA
jgi:hypothetical protein